MVCLPFTARFACILGFHARHAPSKRCVVRFGGKTPVYSTRVSTQVMGVCTLGISRVIFIAGRTISR